MIQLKEKVKLIPQPIWDELENFMGEKLSSKGDLYEQQLHEIIIEFMGCISTKKLFLDIIKVAAESLTTWAEDE